MNNASNETVFAPTTEQVIASAVQVTLDETNEVDIKDFPELTEAALYGVAGEFTKFVTQDSEADRAAVLVTFLTFTGALFGTKCYARVGASKHHPRLFSAIAGASSRARKGTSYDPVKLLSEEMHQKYADIEKLKIAPGGLSSGEGLVYAVRDASDAKQKDSDEPEDAGVTDKRLLVVESELGSPLKASRREGNILSGTMRSAWDSGDMAPLTKMNRIKSTNAHVCIVGHITVEELKILLTQSDTYNGFANRFLWICARRRQLVPIPKNLEQSRLELFSDKLATAIESANFREEQRTNCIRFAPEAETLWIGVYPTLTQDLPGPVGVVTARAEAQVLRLALIFALLDSAPEIAVPHLNAALALWDYCKASAAYLFGIGLDDSISVKIIDSLKHGRKSQNDIRRLFSGNLDAAKLREALSHLQSAGRIHQVKEQLGAGRPTVFWQLNEDFTPTP